MRIYQKKKKRFGGKYQDKYGQKRVIKTKKNHNSSKEKQIFNMISSIKKSDGTIIGDPESIALEDVNHFECILNNQGVYDRIAQVDLLSNILHIISLQKNKMLSAKFTKEEVEVALHNFNPNKYLVLKRCQIWKDMMIIDLYIYVILYLSYLQILWTIS